MANSAQQQGDSLEQVRATERKQIELRRERAGLPTDSDAASLNDTVGLALSGGGIRSASFNLGLLQALRKFKLLRLVDYLSTVSGGGYVGSYLSSLTLHDRADELFGSKSANDSSREPSNSKQQDHELEPNAGDRQPWSIRRLIRYGQNMVQPMRFLNRMLIGMVLINLVVFSGLIALCAFVAILFRFLDHPSSMNWLGAIGFQDDLSRAFFPTCLLFFLWLGAWSISYWRYNGQSKGQHARRLLLPLLASIPIAIAALLGTGDISINRLLELLGLEQSQAIEDFVSTLGEYASLIFVGIILIGLVPIVKPKLLLRSGIKPSGTAERATFWFTSRALLVGMPLLIFGLIARENISRFNDTRNDLRTAEIEDAELFWVRASKESKSWSDQLAKRGVASSTDQVGYWIWQAALDSKAHNEELDGPLPQEIAQSKRLRSRADAINEQLSFFERWRLLGSIWMAGSGSANPVYEIVHLRAEAKGLQGKVYNRVTDETLSLPGFYAALDSTYATHPPSENNTLEKDQLKKMRAKLASAKVLKSRHEEIADQIAESKDTEEQDSLNAKKEQLEHSITKNNREMLRLHYHDCMRAQSKVYATNVSVEDQKTRLWILAMALAVFGLSSWCVDMNATTLHNYYRARLAETWIDKTVQADHHIPLKQLKNAEMGAPVHLINATLNRIAWNHDPAESHLEGFLFSSEFCGSNGTEYCLTDDYMNGEYDLANAMALSGGAVNPIQFDNPLVMVLSLLFNFRLGQWLPNPSRPDTPLKPTPLRLVFDILSNAEHRRYCLITDGGHYENLGIEPLLLRRCKYIIVSDATCDPEYNFQDLVQVHQRMRINHGIRLYELNRSDEDRDLPLGAVSPQGEKLLSQSHFFVGRIQYPEPDVEDGYLVYIKPSFTGDEGLESFAYRGKTQVFPHDPTSDQAFSAQKFEAYRKLGYHIGESFAREALSKDAALSAKRLFKNLLPSSNDNWRSGNTDDEGAHQESSCVTLDTPEEVQALLPWLASWSPDHRDIAHRVLSHVEPADAILECLLAALGERNPKIQSGVAEILGNLAESAMSTPDQVARIRNQLVRSLSDPNMQVRENAERSLQRIKRIQRRERFLQSVTAPLNASENASPEPPRTAK